jgi:hypothetical protein
MLCLRLFRAELPGGAEIHGAAEVSTLREANSAEKRSEHRERASQGVDTENAVVR